jgi:DNA mismatch endonuclease, patch repair protein
MKSKDTTPEILLRSQLYALGLRYRLHNKKLPGSPDIVFSGNKLAVFVHGCYWHRHARCVGERFPSVQNQEWAKRHNVQVKRDREVQSKLKAKGWNVYISWECQIKKNALVEAQKVDQVLRKLKAANI